MSDIKKLTEFLIEKAYRSDCEICKLMGWQCPVQIEEEKANNEKWMEYEPDTSACRPFLEQKIIETLTYSKD